MPQAEESAIPAIHQDCHAVAAAVGHHDVQVSVPVQVPEIQALRKRAHRVLDGVLEGEGPVSLVHENRSYTRKLVMV